MFKDQLTTEEIRRFLALQPFVVYRERITEYIVMVRDGTNLIPCDVIYAKDHVEAIVILEYRKREPSNLLRQRYELVCLQRDTQDQFMFVFGDKR